MRLRVFLVLFCLVPTLVRSESPVVPTEIHFAGMQLKLTEKARQKIQADVDALTRSPTHFQIKVDRANMYFPIIERVFKQEGLPEDFKYLVLQESALISDAVSSSNAVGYWQFKKGTALEVGLRVDQYVDERLNIVSSSRGAAHYMKKNNRVYFDNWVYALLAYQQGAGGAMKLTNSKYNGARKMSIGAKTHWYVMKFLAHKIAFENAVGKGAPPPTQLLEYRDGKNKTLRQIAGEVNASFEAVQDYNKWLRRGKVPADKDYTVIVPVKEGQQKLLARASTKKKVGEDNRPQRAKVNPSKQSKYPIIQGASRGRSEAQMIKVNSLPGIMAGEQQDIIDLARKSGISVRQFMRFNDLRRRPKIKAGEVYYLKAKRSKAKEHHHVVQPGEDLWSISQRYGVKLNKLKQKNRITGREVLKPGRVLWLRFIRPKEEAIAYQSVGTPTEKKLSKKQVSRPPKMKAPSIPLDTARVKEIATQSKPIESQEKKQEITHKKESEPKQDPLLVEEEFKLDQPVTFVGVEESDNPTNADKKVHVVQQGETLYGIAKSYSLTVEQLQVMNQMTDAPPLRIGQNLIVGDMKTNEPSIEKDANVTYRDHKVKEGETLYQIARHYKVTIKEIMEWNQKSDFNLSFGEILKIKQ
ncbi:MAG: LysM peptidoglycan-binding domain-containing protein [Cyclobacteriaceae bacterium]